jgi:hypothetical protein
VLLDVQVVLAVLLVQVLLQLLETQSVALLICAVSPILHLQALVGKMYEVIFILKVILGAAGPHVAVLVKINSEIISNCGPDSKIELTFFIQKRFFDILLNYPESLL